MIIIPCINKGLDNSVYQKSVLGDSISMPSIFKNGIKTEF